MLQPPSSLKLSSLKRDHVTFMEWRSSWSQMTSIRTLIMINTDTGEVGNIIDINYPNLLVLKAQKQQYF